eukprot:CAMPEP_0177640454 /NCGR_PEP_ID=MMETSP0447-20121125/6551_1 /TAXON_ID=0 /ORGANISM="Stygamoeba regulata, Strain BSH-02190019" /LENGTH=155 /DNA_ID=CAMNT_0019142525 /DNA_START=236 /DNA_END=703 /DNA_ORIENTATION=-
MADEETAYVYNNQVIEFSKRGYNEDLEELFNGEDGANLTVNFRDSVGNTAMYWAAFGGHADVVTLLAQKGWDVNLSNIKGESPLHAAAWKNHADAVAALLEAGADKDAVNKSGQKPLNVARAPEVRRLLVPPVEVEGDEGDAESDDESGEDDPPA